MKIRIRVAVAALCSLMAADGLAQSRGGAADAPQVELFSQPHFLLSQDIVERVFQGMPDKRSLVPQRINFERVGFAATSVFLCNVDRAVRPTQIETMSGKYNRGAQFNVIAPGDTFIGAIPLYLKKRDEIVGLEAAKSACLADYGETVSPRGYPVFYIFGALREEPRLTRNRSGFSTGTDGYDRFIRPEHIVYAGVVNNEAAAPGFDPWRTKAFRALTGAPETEAEPSLALPLTDEAVADMCATVGLLFSQAPYFASAPAFLPRFGFALASTRAESSARLYRFAGDKHDLYLSFERDKADEVKLVIAGPSPEPTTEAAVACLQAQGGDLDAAAPETWLMKRSGEQFLIQARQGLENGRPLTLLHIGHMGTPSAN